MTQSCISNYPLIRQTRGQAIQESRSNNCFRRFVVSRGLHLGLVPITLVTNALDSMIGLGIGVAAVCTAGTHRKIALLTNTYLSRSHYLLTDPFVHLLRAVNPNASFRNNSVISASGCGFLPELVLPKLASASLKSRNSSNFFQRHCISRLTSALMGLAAIVTRIADAVIALPAAAAALLTYGKIVSINNLAYRTLQAPGLIDDLLSSLVITMNPSTYL